MISGDMLNETIKEIIFGTNSDEYTDQMHDDLAL